MSSACSQDTSPLHAAVRASDTAAIRAHLDARPNDVDVEDLEGRTPLHVAVAESFCLASCRALLAKGADPNRVDPRDGEGMAPLHRAVVNGDECEPIALALLASGARVDGATGGPGGLSPLHLAAGSGHDALARLLISRGADVNARARDGCTPLHLAAGGGHESTVKLLLEHNADRRAKNKEFLTPDYAAARAAHAGVVDLILGPRDTRALNAPHKKKKTSRHRRHQ